MKRKSNLCQFITVKELPALGYLYNNVCNDVTCAGMPVAQIHVLINSLLIYFLRELNSGIPLQWLLR